MLFLIVQSFFFLNAMKSQKNVSSSHEITLILNGQREFFTLDFGFKFNLYFLWIFATFSNEIFLNKLITRDTCTYSLSGLIFSFETLAFKLYLSTFKVEITIIIKHFQWKKKLQWKSTFWLFKQKNVLNEKPIKKITNLKCFINFIAL